MAWLIDLISSLFKAIIPTVVAQIEAPDTGKKADAADPILSKSLHDRVRKHESDIRGVGINRKDWTRR